MFSLYGDVDYLVGTSHYDYKVGVSRAFYSFDRKKVVCIRKGLEYGLLPYRSQGTVELDGSAVFGKVSGLHTFDLDPRPPSHRGNSGGRGYPIILGRPLPPPEGDLYWVSNL